MKLSQWKFRLHIRKRFITEMLVGHWKRLPGEVVMTLSLSDVKELLDNAHSHMVYF